MTHDWEGSASLSEGNFFRDDRPDTETRLRRGWRRRRHWASVRYRVWRCRTCGTVLVMPPCGSPGPHVRHYPNLMGPDVVLLPDCDEALADGVLRS